MKAKISLMGKLCPKIKQITNIPIGIYKPPIVTFLILLCFVFAAKAQEIEVHSTPVAKAETKTVNPDITPLEIGERIPDELWDLPLQVVNHPEGKETITLKDYRGKLIILDFWATWCSPCISSLNKLQKQQSKFEGDLMIIPSTYESNEKAIKLLIDKMIDLPSVFGEKNKILRAYFPHKVVPHQIWIKDRHVYGITSSEQSTADNIESVLTDKQLKLREKRDLTVDYFKPITKYLNEQDATLYFQSTLTGFINGASGAGQRENDSLKVYYFFNRPVINLYTTTLNLPLNRLLLDIRNKDAFVNWIFRYIGRHDSDTKYATYSAA